MNMKNFKKFLEEATIKDNPGIPGEPNKKDGESKYTNDVERRAKDRLGITDRDTQRRMGPRGPMPSETEIRTGMELMQLLERSLGFTNGKEDELSELAEKVFRNLYQDLIDRYEIELDIKIIKPGRVKKWMDDQEEEQDNPPDPEFKEVVEEDIRNEVHKRKIANLIIQGEAKNTKHVLHSEEIKDGLDEIYGDESEEVFNLWDRMSKLADKLDWIIPPDVRAEMMEQMPDGMAGASSVQWKPKEEEESQEEDDDEENQEDFFGGEEEDEESYEEDEAPMERFDKTPIIRARGVDFPMLLHEAVKGLFELLSIPGIPEDERTANIALSNTGIGDEPEDWKYGPEIASDLRDFINENKDIEKYPNIREEVYKMMVDKETMPTTSFLELMRGILSKSPKARRDIDRLVAKVIKDKEEMEQYKKDMEEYDRQMSEYEKEKKNPRNTQSKPKEEPKEEVEEDSEIDYSTMSPSELQKEMDKALDSGDYTLAHTISSHMKNESRIIYDRELKMILERKNQHTK